MGAYTFLWCKNAVSIQVEAYVYICMLKKIQMAFIWDIIKLFDSFSLVLVFLWYPH